MGLRRGNALRGILAEAVTGENRAGGSGSANCKGLFPFKKQWFDHFRARA